MKKLAPGEGFPIFIGTGWLIPNAFGTLPAEKVIDICPALLTFNLFLPFHCCRTSLIFLCVHASPRSLFALCVL